MKPSNEDAAELALAALLDVLASVLIPLEITPARLAQIARASFVKASVSQAQVRSSGRPHLARIAALTGLSRAEVKRLVSSNYAIGRQEPDSSPRALRVLGAWRASKRYTNAGRPISLRVNGPFPSFETLCREFSGDIPYKVILTELERRANVKFRKKRSWVSVSKANKSGPAKQRELSNLIFAASLIGEFSQSGSILVKRKEKIGAPLDIHSSYVENAIASRVTDLLDNLPQLFVSGKNARKSRACVNVYTLVSRSRPTQKKLRS
jgi:hypothetical protein